MFPIYSTLLSVCRTWGLWAMKVDLRCYLGNTDSINITPVHPVSILHSYHMPLWTCQNVLHILFLREYLCKARKVARNQKGKKPNERNQKREASTREWEWTKIGEPASLQCFKVCSTCRHLQFQTLHVCTRAHLGPRPRQWQHHPGRSLELASTWRRPTQAKHRGKSMGLEDRSEIEC